MDELPPAEIAPRHARAPRACRGIREIADRYEGFVVDQWGVLHDGSHPYPGVVDCLEHLQRAGKPVVIVSNSGKPSAANAERMRALGLPPSLYAALITSGEVTRRLLMERADPLVADLGRRCLLISRGGDRTIVDGLDLEFTSDPGAAEFILLAGLDEAPEAADRHAEVLRRAAQRGLPLLCANPDAIGVSPQGAVICPGTLADHYAEMGGHVRLVGKPYPEIYRSCLSELGLRDSQTVAAVGDSLANDIAGGVAMGFDTVLVSGGIHAASFDGATDPAGVAHNLGARSGAVPDWVVQTFRW